MKNMNLTPQSQKRTTVAQLANVPDNTRSSTYWQTTSIKVDPEQWKRVKREAFEQDLTVQEFVHQALEAWLDQ
ncbi:hypothetical protein [Bifidobacterium dentium]|uniref:hypothetical protein n=1 Tax=Bifidobacterium dentium TaxID=1689 RepID=UPI0013BE7392|nr:hypothetical protein [Bifidobacterium dentium]NEG41151.1 hypothetical protein [Bifidobacterium dentium]